MKAQLADGRVLNFPDGTDPEVIKATVKRVLANGVAPPAAQAPSAAPSGPDYASPEAEAIDKIGLMRFINGAGSMTRGMMNTLEPGSGEALKVTPSQTPSGFETLGNLADPAGLALGGAAAKLLPYQKLMGNGLFSGLKALGKNMASGATTGAAMGSVSEHGDAASGAAYGAGVMAIPAAGAAGKWLGQKVYEGAVAPFTEAGRTQFAREWLAKHLGEAKGKVAEALMAARQIVPGSPVTAADAIAAANVGQATKVGAPLVAAQGVLERQPRLADLAKSAVASGEAARAGQIGQIAGTPQQIAVAMQARKAATDPLREQSLEAANRLGQKVSDLQRTAATSEAAGQRLQQLQGEAVGTEAQQAGVAGVGTGPQGGRGMGPIETRAREATGNQRTPIVGDASASRVGSVAMPRNPNRYGTEGLGGNARKSAEAANEAWAQKGVKQAEADLANWQLQTLRSHGLEPLNGAKLSGAVESRLNDPSIGVSDLNRRVIRKVASKIQEWTTRGGGKLDARALYEIRKTTINEEVDRLMPNAAAAAKNRRAAGLLTDIKPIIDDAIEKAGGADWRKYLTDYSDRSAKIDRMKIGEALQEALVSPADRETPARLLSTVRNMESELGSKLTPQESAIVQRVTDELQRNAERKSLASGVDIGGALHITDSGRLEIPHILSRAATASNWLMGKFGEAADQKIAQDMGRLMIQDPAGFARKYLADVPKGRAQVIMEMLKRNAAKIPAVSPSASYSAVSGEGK